MVTWKWSIVRYAPMNAYDISGVGRFDVPYQPRVEAIVAPPNPPAALVELFPSLPGAIARSSGQPNLYWETWPPDMEVVKWGWARFDRWTDVSQSYFEKEWSPSLDEWVDSLVAKHASSWHLALPFVAKRDQPEFSAGGVALDYGPWLTTIKRRTWPYPTMSHCEVCGADYFHDCVRYFLIRRWGEPGICPRCGFAAMMGQNAPRSLDKQGVEAGLQALRRLADVVGVIPPQNFRVAFAAEGLDRPTRAKLVAGLLCAPDDGDHLAVSFVQLQTGTLAAQLANGR